MGENIFYNGIVSVALFFVLAFLMFSFAFYFYCFFLMWSVWMVGKNGKKISTDYMFPSY